MFNCKFKNNCPHLNNRSCSQVLAENEHWKKRVEHMYQIMKLAEEKILNLQEKIKLLVEEKESIQQELNLVIPCGLPQGKQM